MHAMSRTAGGVKTLLLIVVLAVTGVIAFLNIRRNAGQEVTIDRSELKDIQTDEDAKDIWEVDAPGVDPGEDPQFEITHEIRQEGAQTWIYFYVREKHGWAVDGIYIDFWHQSKDPETGEWKRDSRVDQYLTRQPLDFNATLEDKATLMSDEFPSLDPNNYGSTEDWAVAVKQWIRVRAPEKAG